MKIRKKMRLAVTALAVALLLPLSLLGTEPAPARVPGSAGLEAYLQDLIGGRGETPTYTDLGGGFYSLSMPLRPEVEAQLVEALREASPEKAAAPALTVVSVGLAPVLPPNPIATSHGALSDTTFPYTYWIITVNLGPQTVTKSTTAKLAGPGLKFNRSVNVIYGANGIWGIGYSPGRGVGTPGLYTFTGSVSGGGSITTKTFAVHP